MEDIGAYASAAATALGFHIRRFGYAWCIAFALIVMLGISGYLYFLAPPVDFPSGSLVVVKHGESVVAAGNELYDAHVIRSPLAFHAFVRIFGDDGVYA
jgi:cell division protein YceG involved in septum cleavage